MKILRASSILGILSNYYKWASNSCNLIAVSRYTQYTTSHRYNQPVKMIQERDQAPQSFHGQLMAVRQVFN